MVLSFRVSRVAAISSEPTDTVRAPEIETTHGGVGQAELRVRVTVRKKIPALQAEMTVRIEGVPPSTRVRGVARTSRSLVTRPETGIRRVNVVVPALGATVTERQIVSLDTVVPTLTESPTSSTSVTSTLPRQPGPSITFAPTGVGTIEKGRM